MRLTKFIIQLTLLVLVWSCGNKQNSVSYSRAGVSKLDAPANTTPCTMVMEFMNFYIPKLDSLQVEYNKIYQLKGEEKLNQINNILKSNFLKEYFATSYVDSLRAILLIDSFNPNKIEPVLQTRYYKDLKYEDLECLDGGWDPYGKLHILNLYIKDSDEPLLLTVIVENGDYKISMFYEGP